MKTSILPEIASLTLPETSRLGAAIRILPEHVTTLLLILESFLEQARPPAGNTEGWWATDSTDTTQPEENLLEGLLTERLEKLPVSPRQMGKARAEAESLLGQGIWAATWIHAPAGKPDGPDCPRVFFGKGNLPSDVPWVAFFNSRKPRTFSPREEWLAALRLLLPHVVSRGGGIASSVGTLTYDLATTCAKQTGSPLLLVLPFPLRHLEGRRPHALLKGPDYSGTLLSAASRAMSSSRPLNPRRRDRMLARLVDVHCVLAVRPGGNLLPILEDEQSLQPRHRWVLVPNRRSLENEGNLRLLETGSEWTRTFTLCIQEEPASSPEPAAPQSPQVNWKNFLFHYTRACSGPWPGQSVEEYLQSLLRGDSNSGHTALDTLMRIVTEGKIRAGSRLVRGSEPVVSWTSKPPPEFESIRRWNPALIRWTFEPFGIAVARRALRKIGAKPVIYGGEALYARLDPSGRFRFQLHRPPRCSWKHEREWRSRGDLPLATIPAGEAILLVPGPGEAAVIRGSARCGFPVLDLSSIPGNLTKSTGGDESPIN